MSKGDVCHIEFSTTDLAATRTFYEEIFGWTFRTVPGMEEYAMFATPSGIGGGMDCSARNEPPTDKGPIVHLEVDDIDSTLTRIEELGGKTVRGKTPISDTFGSFAVFLDCVGNRLGLWSQS